MAEKTWKIAAWRQFKLAALQLFELKVQVEVGRFAAMVSGAASLPVYV